MQGAAHESADVEDLNSWHDQLNGYMRNIASANVALWTHIVRREYGEFPGGEFAPGFCREFNEKYRERMADEIMLGNELFMPIVYWPKPSKAAKGGGGWRSGRAGIGRGAVPLPWLPSLCDGWR